MRYTVEITTRGTRMLEMLEVDTQQYDIESFSEDDMEKILGEDIMDAMFCFAMPEGFGDEQTGAFKIDVTDEDGKKVYASKDENELNDMLDFDDELEDIVAEHEMNVDSYAPGYYLVRDCVEETATHLFHIETDDFDIENLVMVNMKGYLGLLDYDSWSSIFCLTYDGHYLERENEDDGVDYHSEGIYLCNKNSRGWWSIVKEF